MDIDSRRWGRPVDIDSRRVIDPRRVVPYVHIDPRRVIPCVHIDLRRMRLFSSCSARWHDPRVRQRRGMQTLSLAAAAADESTRAPGVA